jgi:hypothetical protein
MKRPWAGKHTAHAQQIMPLNANWRHLLVNRTHSQTYLLLLLKTGALDDMAGQAPLELLDQANTNTESASPRCVGDKPSSPAALLPADHAMRASPAAPPPPPRACSPAPLLMVPC